jgi:hypothetical protein
MRNRFGSDSVMKQFGWNVEEAQEVLNKSENSKLFNNLLFAKIQGRRIKIRNAAFAHFVARRVVPAKGEAT